MGDNVQQMMKQIAMQQPYGITKKKACQFYQHRPQRNSTFTQMVHEIPQFSHASSLEKKVLLWKSSFWYHFSG